MRVRYIMFYALAIVPNDDMAKVDHGSLALPHSAKYVNAKYVDTLAGLTDQPATGYRLDVATRYRERVAADLPGDTHTVSLVAVIDNGRRFDLVLGSGVRCAI